MLRETLSPRDGESRGLDQHLNPLKPEEALAAMPTLPTEDTEPDTDVCIACGWFGWEHAVRPEHCWAQTPYGSTWMAGYELGKEVGIRIGRAEAKAE